MTGGLYYVCSGDRLVAAESDDGYILPLFPRLADAEEFLVGAQMSGEGWPVLCPDMLADLCRLCVPTPGVRWIVMGPPPQSEIDCDRQQLVSVERFLAAFRKVYAGESGGERV